MRRPYAHHHRRHLAYRRLCASHAQPRRTGRQTPAGPSSVHPQQQQPSRRRRRRGSHHGRAEGGPGGGQEASQGHGRPDAGAFQVACPAQGRLLAGRPCRAWPTLASWCSPTQCPCPDDACRSCAQALLNRISYLTAEEAKLDRDIATARQRMEEMLSRKSSHKGDEDVVKTAAEILSTLLRENQHKPRVSKPGGWWVGGDIEGTSVAVDGTLTCRPAGVVARDLCVAECMTYIHVCMYLKDCFPCCCAVLCVRGWVHGTTTQVGRARELARGLWRRSRRPGRRRGPPAQHGPPGQGQRPQHRRRQALPGLSSSWGAASQVGTGAAAAAAWGRHIAGFGVRQATEATAMQRWCTGTGYHKAAWYRAPVAGLLRGGAAGARYGVQGGRAWCAAVRLHKCPLSCWALMVSCPFAMLIFDRCAPGRHGSCGASCRGGRAAAAAPQRGPHAADQQCGERQQRRIRYRCCGRPSRPTTTRPCPR